MADESNEVFGILHDAVTQKSTVVIVKSKALKSLVEGGMDLEEAEEYYEYNIAGSLGSGQYSCVDDTLDLEAIQEMVSTGDAEDPKNPPVVKAHKAPKKARKR